MASFCNYDHEGRISWRDFFIILETIERKLLNHKVQEHGLQQE